MPDAGTHDKHLAATNSADAITFLQDFDPTGWHNLVAIGANTGQVHGRTFAPGALHEAAPWAADMNAAGFNIYFSVNEPSPHAPDTKLGKDHIARIRAVYVDADPRKDKPFDDERQRLLDLAKAAGRSPCPPTHTVDSGGGVQFFWKLDEKLPADQHTRWAEEQGRGLAHALGGGDAVQNIDRIMRLPGTTNIPDAKKRARGRQEAPARLIAHTPTTYAPEALTAYAPPRRADERLDNSDEIAAIQSAIDMQAVEHGPDAELIARIKRAEATDDRLRAIINGDPLRGDDQSGSAYRAALVARLCVAGGFTPTEYATIAHHLAHCRTKDDVAGGWRRQYAREWCNIGVRHAVEHWFAPVPDVDLNPFEQAAAAEQAERADNNDPDRFQFISLTEAADLAITEASEPLIEGLLDAGAMTVLYGESNVGKTFVALDMAFHIWAGKPYAGMPTTKREVIYIAAEGGVGILKRARALMIEHNISDGTGFHILRSQVNLLDPDADLNALIAAIQRASSGPGLVVIDTVSRALAGGDENTSTDMGAFVRNLDALRLATRAHVMGIHHSGKDKAKGARGHSLLRAATDTEIEVGEGRIAVTKQRDLECGWSTGFGLKSVELGLDGRGRPLRSAVVELRQDAGPGETGAAGTKLTALQGEVLGAVAMLTATSTTRDGPTTGQVATALEGKRAYGSVRNALSTLQKLGHLRADEAGAWTLSAGQVVSETCPGGVFD